ncbi:MAG: hypothetical protein H0T79_01545, partial [Deltaproteobacteria bacterium]|nr:hypothetical protein [Deltaproteobacteria bacterium]
MHPAGIAEIATLVGNLAHTTHRNTMSRELARALGAEALLILVRDPELPVLLPAPGFPQTLRGGPEWRRFLTLLVEPGRHTAVVDYPAPDDHTPVMAHVCADGTAFVLFGETVTPGALDGVVPMLPLV